MELQRCCEQPVKVYGRGFCVLVDRERSQINADGKGREVERWDAGDHRSQGFDIKVIIYYCRYNRLFVVLADVSKCNRLLLFAKRVTYCVTSD